MISSLLGFHFYKSHIPKIFTLCLLIPCPCSSDLFFFLLPFQFLGQHKTWTGTSS
jgi:hypothetical protein